MITCTCPHCGGEISPASLLGKSKKTMTPAALEARKANAAKPRTMTPAKAAALARATEGRKAAAKRRRETAPE